MPEPSPLFWDHLSARIKDAVGVEPPPRWSLADALAWRCARCRRAPSPSWCSPWSLGVSCAAVRRTTVTPRSREAPGDRTRRPVAPDGHAGHCPSTIRRWSSLRISREGLDWDAATEAGWTAATASLDQALGG